MKLRQGFAVFAAAGMLVSLASIAGAETNDSTTLAPPPGVTTDPPGMTTDQPGMDQPGVTRDQPTIGDQQPGGTAQSSGVIEGKVAAIDESGHVLLHTAEGLLALRVSPDQVQGVSVGQTVRVAVGGDEPETY